MLLTTKFKKIEYFKTKARTKPVLSELRNTLKKTENLFGPF
jgi:hypothetical protein